MYSSICQAKSKLILLYLCKLNLTPTGGLKFFTILMTFPKKEVQWLIETNLLLKIREDKGAFSDYKQISFKLL